MKLKLVNEAGEQQFFAIAHREDTAIREIWKYIKTDFGPLSKEPTTLADLSDAVADAFGGELGLVVED